MNKTTNEHKTHVAEKCQKCEKFYRTKYQEPCCSAYNVILPCGDKPYCKIEKSDKAVRK